MENKYRNFKKFECCDKQKLERYSRSDCTDCDFQYNDFDEDGYGTTVEDDCECQQGEAFGRGCVISRCINCNAVKHIPWCD